MAEFTEVMKQKSRMCENAKRCNDCPLLKPSNGLCANFMQNYPQKAENIILKWAEENPVDSIESKILESLDKTEINSFDDMKEWIKDFNKASTEIIIGKIEKLMGD